MPFKFIIPITFLSPGLLFGFIVLLCLSQTSAQEVKLEKIFNLQPVKGLEHILWSGDIFEDHLGYIWIGGQTGLYKFDGYKTTHYSFDPTQPDKIAGNWIFGITEDDEGNIWFGVFGIGLQKLNPATGKFTLYKDNEKGKKSLETINNLIINQDRIWIGSQNVLCAFSTKTGKIKYFPEIQNSLPFEINGYIWTLSHDNTLFYFDPTKNNMVRFDSLVIKSRVLISPVVVQNKIYINDISGNFYRYDYKSKKLEYLNSPNNKSTFEQMFAIDNNYIYMTNDKSFMIYDIEKKTFTTPVLDNTFANRDNYIYDMYKLNNGNLWIIEDKVYTTSAGDQGVESYTLKSGNKDINIYSNATLNQWDGHSPGIGISFLLDFENQDAERVSVRYPHLSVFDSAYISGKQDVKTYTDKNKDIWMTYEQWNHPRKKTIYYLSPPSYNIKKIGVVSKPIGKIFGITKIDENLWIGCWGGLLKWNLSDNTETYFKSGKDDSSLTSENIRYVFKDRDDDLWISTQNGLNLKKKNQDRFIHYFSILGDTTSLSLNTTSTIAQDSSGIIWIATFGGGVNSFDKKTGKFRWYTTKNGLADNNVLNVLIDDFQDVWVSHDAGISKINPKTGKILNIDKSDGIVSIGEQNSLKMSDGSLVFAGDGFNRIFPNRIKTDTFVPRLLITNLKLHNKDVLINGPDSILRQNINITKEITLQYKKNVITLEYAALDMVHADKRLYAYQLVGFDPDWQYVDKKREVTYTNLPPGDYIFKVKSSMDEENWTEIQHPLIINILPPWYRTWWAYGFYLLLLSYAGWKLHQYQKAKTIAREREKARERELEHAKEIEIAYAELGKSHENLKSTQAQLIQSEKMASLGELTAGIAHEIQNPLNFVNNFSEVSNELMVDMVDEVDKGNYDEVKAIALDVQQNLTKINHHGKRASSIVKGMLEHSRKSSGTKELTDINALADEYLKLAFQSLRAKDKDFNAELSTDLDPHLPKIEVVSQDIGRVLLNLITNAFYAVNERSKNGEAGYEPKVSVITKRFVTPSGAGGEQGKNENIQISVSDNGPGIPDAIKDKIFQPFFTTKPTGQGTGLGLSLSYDIIKAHGGTIRVESYTNQGTTFTITI